MIFELNNFGGFLGLLEEAEFYNLSRLISLCNERILERERKKLQLVRIKLAVSHFIQWTVYPTGTLHPIRTLCPMMALRPMDTSSNEHFG
jgi:hypothetical protein